MPGSSDITVQIVLISGTANDSCQMFATSRDLTAAAAAWIAGTRQR